MQCGIHGPCNTTGHGAKSREHRPAPPELMSDNQTVIRKSSSNPTKGHPAQAGMQKPQCILLPQEGMG